MGVNTADICMLHPCENQRDSRVTAGRLQLQLSTSPGLQHLAAIIPYTVLFTVYPACLGHL